MNAFRFFKFITCLFPLSFFPTKNRLLKNWPFFTDVFWMVPFFNIVSTSFVTNKDSCADIFGWCGTFFWNGSKMKSVFRPDTHSKIWGCRSVFSSVFQNIAAFLLEENYWLLHLKISFAPIGVYALTGVMKLFLINFYLKVLEEQFPCYRFLPCCVFFQLRNVFIEESWLFVAFSYQGIFYFYTLDCHHFAVGNQSFS